MSMKTKKIPYNLLLLILTSGASLILGFLSFGGMYSLYPILSLALGSFVLSVAYEGEIYLQNIKGALNKLFKSKYLERKSANAFLLEHFPEAIDDNTPSFFKRYVALLTYVRAFGQHGLNETSKLRKKDALTKLKDMEKYFAEIYFSDLEKDEDELKNELRDWIRNCRPRDFLDALNKKRATFTRVKIFSAFAGFFMGLGTTYLLMEAFEVIPFFAALSSTTLPLLITPMAIVAGTAYGLLTYNAMTDMIGNRTLQKWFERIQTAYKKEGFTPYNVFLITSSILLSILAICLTVCTAGTWWTIAKETKPLFAWMGRLPGFVMGVVNPVITGLSMVVFTLTNSKETLDLIEQKLQSLLHDNNHSQTIFSRAQNHFNSFQNALARLIVLPIRGILFLLHTGSTQLSIAASVISTGFKDLNERETLGQMLNPARAIIVLTVLPLRIILFLGHLISIGVTADKVPGISPYTSALWGFISEFFEDLHYFMHGDHHCSGHHSHEASPKEMATTRLSPAHSHSHDVDIPTRVIKIIFTPLYYMAAAWDNAFSQNPQLFSELLFKHRGKEVCEIKPHSETFVSWEAEMAHFRIQRLIKDSRQAMINKPLAVQKASELEKLCDHMKLLMQSGKPMQAIKLLKEKSQSELYKQRRYGWSLFGEETSTEYGLSKAQRLVECNLSESASAIRPC
jgi:hypothetical protein